MLKVSSTHSVPENIGVHNGPLSPGVEYRIQQRNYAATGDGEALGWVSVKTPSPPEGESPILAIVLGVVFAIVVIILIVVAVFFYQKRRGKLDDYDDDEEGAIQMHPRSRSRIGTIVGKIRRGGPISGIGKTVARSFPFALC